MAQFITQIEDEEIEQPPQQQQTEEKQYEHFKKDEVKLILKGDAIHFILRNSMEPFTWLCALTYKMLLESNKKWIVFGTIDQLFNDLVELTKQNKFQKIRTFKEITLLFRFQIHKSFLQLEVQLQPETNMNITQMCEEFAHLIAKTKMKYEAKLSRIKKLYLERQKEKLIYLNQGVYRISSKNNWQDLQNAKATTKLKKQIKYQILLIFQGEYCLIAETIAYRLKITNSSDFGSQETTTSYIPTEDGWKKYMPVYNNNNNYQSFHQTAQITGLDDVDAEFQFQIQIKAQKYNCDTGNGGITLIIQQI